LRLEEQPGARFAPELWAQPRDHLVRGDLAFLDRL
jgi:hypothetical protein